VGLGPDLELVTLEEEEAATLSGFGVEFGQGYLFGHPEPVGPWGGSHTLSGPLAADACRRLGGAQGCPTLRPVARKPVRVEHP